MITNIPFQTRARTIDHLGREQIADCPTAISELWKNAYDAYARNVTLHLFDGDVPIAAIVDDGHGMSFDEFINKWLVVGTDSKVSNSISPEEDRNGLDVRPRQGQKGIGRLSSGAMGSFLLLISKRKDKKFIASLIDWRLFENPYLYLQDISLPIIEFDDKNELAHNLEGMFDSLISNVWPNSNDKSRDERVRLAWEMFDNIEREDGVKKTTSEFISETIIETVINSYHLEKWDTWTGKKDQGTALFVSNISFELKTLLEDRSISVDDLDKGIQHNVFTTLSGFYDPFKMDYSNDPFDYEVLIWHNSNLRTFLSKNTQFNLQDVYNLEHYIDGQFDNMGIFRGRIRAFGQDLGDVEIPPINVINNTNTRDRVGSFDIVAGAFEGLQVNSTHTPEEHAYIFEQSSLYSGLGVYRDNLRILPYGKPDNDFFLMEFKRSKNTGGSFWSNRRTFGRVSLTRNNNKNLRDKAGREGFIDNRARNVFKNLVTNLLQEVANRYFGSYSIVRKERLPLIQQANIERAKEEAKKQKKQSRTHFRNTLRTNEGALENKIVRLESLKQEVEESIQANDGDELFVILQKVNICKSERSDLRLPPPPKKLGTLEEDFNTYRNKFVAYSNNIDEEYEKVSKEVARLKPRIPEEIALSALRSNAKALHDQFRKWKNSVVEILVNEKSKIENKVADENKFYDLKTHSLIDDLVNGRTTLVFVLNELDEIRNSLEIEYSEYYDPYIRSLTQLSQGIDLDSAGTWNSERAEELEKDLEQFTSLAQLGITVELVSHELERLDQTIGTHLRDLPLEVQKTKSFQVAFDAHAELMERLRFLSPLKLSGRSTNRSKITGERITAYILEFFKRAFQVSNISLEVSDRFKSIQFEEYRSRIYPVFINLINNSRYWVAQKEGERRILLDVINDKIIVVKKLLCDLYYVITVSN
jgi:hypothetical protein